MLEASRTTLNIPVNLRYIWLSASMGKEDSYIVVPPSPRVSILWRATQQLHSHFSKTHQKWKSKKRSLSAQCKLVQPLGKIITWCLAKKKKKVKCTNPLTQQVGLGIYTTDFPSPLWKSWSSRMSSVARRHWEHSDVHWERTDLKKRPATVRCTLQPFLPSLLSFFVRPIYVEIIHKINQMIQMRGTKLCG